MSFILERQYLTESSKKLIREKCIFVKESTQYDPKPSKIKCFSSFENHLVLPLGLWREFYDSFPNAYDFPQTKAKFKGQLLTKDIDEKKRDQDVVVKECLELLQRDHFVFAALHTGFGKSACAIYITCALKLKTLIVCHFSTVNSGFMKEITRFSNLKVQLVEGKRIDSDADVYIMGILKASSMDSSFFHSIGFVIVDEAHIVTQKCFTEVLLKIQPRYLMLMTATPWRSDGLEKIFEPFSLENIVIRKEVKNFTVVKCLTPFVPKRSYMILRGKSSLNWTKMMGTLAENEERQEFIVNLAAKFVKKHRILILSNLKVQNDGILRLLQEKKIDCDSLYGSKKKYREGCNVLVASTKKAGVGFNDPGLSMLIMACDTQDVSQYEGRIRQSGNLIYHLVDDDPILEKHWQPCELWYYSRGALIKEENHRKNEF